MAETRETQVLEDVVESTEIENPRTTEEAILAQVIAGDEVTINARTRYQTYLKQLTTGGSGNPNYVETITGTVADPFGDYSVEELASLLLSNAITMYASPTGPSIVMEFHALTDDYIEVIGNTKSYSQDFFIFGSYEPETHNVQTYFLSNDGTYIKNTLPDGSITTLTIIHHPLPEDNT